MLEALLEADVEVIEITKSTKVDDEGTNTDILTIRVLPDYLSSAQDVIDKLHHSSDMISNVEYVPNELLTIDEHQYEMNSQLIEEFEGLDDVDRVFHNMKSIN